MAVWETKRIKHCAKLSPPCDTSKLLPDSEVTFTPMECIKNGYFLNRKAPFSTVNGSYTQYQEGDIVIAKVTPCFENGNIAEMSGLYSGFGFGSSELFVLRPYNIQSRFLFYALQSEDFKEKGCATMTGTGGLKRVSPAFIANYQIAVPQPDEQKRIAKFLDKKCAEIDAVMEKTRTSIEEYKKLKQAIITQAVTKGVQGDRPMRESGIEYIPMIPADWSSFRGKHLFYETNERSETGSEELLTVSHKTGITPRSQKNVNMFMSESLIGYKICRKGDIAANTMWMWQGAIGVSAYHGVISPSYNTYRQGNGAFDPQYLDYLLRIQPLVEQYNICSTGITASRLRLYPEQFLSIKFVVPPMEEQQEIVKFLHSRVDEMDTIIQKKERSLTELENYKKSLIYEYVTGKKEILHVTPSD